MKNTNRTFLKDFGYQLPTKSILNQVAIHYLPKALKSLFKEINIENFTNEQIIGIILKIKFSDNSIKSMSTLIRADKTSLRQLTNAFKDCLYSRANDYNSQKAIKIIFSYHIFTDAGSIDKELILSEHNIPVQKIDSSQISFINTHNIFKLPLLFAGYIKFMQDLRELNKNISEVDSTEVKYKIIFDDFSANYIKVKIVLQNDPKVIVYRFIDKIITKPNLTNHEYLLERTIYSLAFRKLQYIIDPVNKEVLLITQEEKRGKRGFISNLKSTKEISEQVLDKFLTIDIETKSVYDNENDILLIPILVATHDFNENKYDYRFLDKTNSEKLRNKDRFSYEIEMQYFFLSFLISKYNGYKIYAHNLSSFDGTFILAQLINLSNTIKLKIEPIFRDGLLLSIKVWYGFRPDRQKFRYSVEFKDSLLLMLSSLNKLSKSFLSDKPELQKLDNKEIMDILLNPNIQGEMGDSFRKSLLKYCVQDCIALSNIINKFAKLVYNLCYINIHKYLTLPSLAFANFLTNYLKSDELIPKVSGNMYKDISKAYTGGHCDVYKMYSTQEVHSYDFSSMYPSVMLKHEYPVAPITNFEGNPLKTGMSLQELAIRKAFIKCDIFVDSSMQRPLYQTHIKMNGQVRTMAATGVFRNQWVYVPELLYYEELTNGLTKIIPESIKCGYLFGSSNLFKDYVTDFYKLKNSVTKNDPLYHISKLFLNSLYGRFGLKQELTQHNILDNFDIENFISDKTINDIIDLSGTNKSLVISSKGLDDVNLRSSVPIAAAVTAYARMELAPMLLDPELDIFYTDTDSFKCSQKITDLERYKHLDHNGLGALKYEETYSESIYLLPKVYGGIIKDSNDILIKMKGFKDNVEFNDLKEVLLQNQKVILHQTKMYKNWMDSEIKMKQTEYTLQLNDNKRIMDLKSLITKPYHFDCYEPENQDN